jgi:Tfp pilus assembly protein PilX
VDFIVDNAVWLSALVLLVLVLASLVVLGLSGLRLFRVLKATQKRAGAAAASLAAEAERLSAAMAALPDRQAEVQDAVASLGARVRVLGVLTSAAADAADTLRAPLRYIGR